jgi:hypothetical protein
MSLLDSHEDLEAHGELFLGHARLEPAIATRSDYPRFVEMHGSQSSLRPGRVVGYLDGLYGRSACAIGFKLMYTQLRAFPEILAYLAWRRVRILHLVRRNHLDVILAEELASLTGTSHATAGQAQEFPKVILNASTLVDRLQRLRRRLAPARTIVRLSTCLSLEISYEALTDSEQEFNRVLDFLEVRRCPIPPRSTLVKRGVRSHRDAIANYDEVSEALAGTEFRRLLA